MSIMRFRKNEQGTVAVIFSIAAFAILSLMALAVDTIILTKTKVKLQTALDFATISSLDIGTGRGFRRDLFEANFDAQVANMSFVNGTVMRSITLTGRLGFVSAETKASVLVDLPFTSILGRDVEITLTSGGENIMPQIELAMVLDISSSMQGTKILELQSASEQVIDTLLDGTSDTVMSIIPFGGSVRLDPALITLLDSPPPRPEYWIGGVWNQCLTYQEDDVRNGFGPADRHEFLTDFTTFGNLVPGRGRSWCPGAGNEAVFATQDNSRAQDLVRNLTLSDGTSTDIGIAWGINALSEEWRGHLPGAEPGFPTTRGTEKVMIVMSDGAIVNQRRPSTSQVNARIGHPDLDDIGAPLYHSTLRVPGYFARTYMQDACDRARNNGITVYTIAFDVDSTQAEDSLRNCAGDPNNYFEADPGDLLNIFEAILDNVAVRRLTL